MLEISRLVSGYSGIEIVRGVSLKVEKGEVLFVVGRNGVGKTTLLKTVVGHIRPVSGRIVIDGLDVTGWPPHAISRLGVGYVPQDRSIFTRLTVEENLRLAEGLNGEILREAFRLFPELEPLRYRRGGELSGGEQQILAVARALASRPKLFVMDEPATGLAPPMVRRIVEVVKRFTGRGASAIIAEQNPALVFQLADRIALMMDGEIAGIIMRDRLAESQQLLRSVLGLSYQDRL
ncbi:High-affinity branched-chain amino acid transport ATP-binding protein LivF [Candidatus Calditenuaceae archaeon HR02]|nr:High-affinity branched-chain amino acid transport ATP-binding protein LivF [Candidatus Calditenuaceae archaeon HR02]